MSLKSLIGLAAAKKVRYGIVALGDISQESLMPGVAHTGNSVITALVTGDTKKATAVADQYQIPYENVYGYEGFNDLLASGKIDAIYLATPNWRHAEFAVPALKAGIHVLLEKPMEVTTELCQQILDAQHARPETKLMIAYRLHFEPATLAMVDLMRSGKLGTLRSFSSTFSQPLDPKNHRAANGDLAGPLFDMGPYPINAVRNLFEAEPTLVSAVGTRHADAGLPMDFDHEVAVILKFGDGRIANFTVSYVAANVDTFTVSGTKGSVRLSPAYGMGKPKVAEVTMGGKTESQTFKATDHFGGELKAFSDCILNDTQLEPDGEEGLLDVRVIQAALRSLEQAKPIALPPLQRQRRIDTKQVEAAAGHATGAGACQLAGEAVTQREISIKHADAWLRSRCRWS